MKILNGIPNEKPKIVSSRFDEQGFSDSVSSWANGKRDKSTRDKLLNTLNIASGLMSNESVNAYRNILRRTTTAEEEAEEKRLDAQPKTYAQRLKESQMREMYYNDQVKKYDAEIASGKHLKSSVEYADALFKRKQFNDMAKSENAKSDIYAKNKKSDYYNSLDNLVLFLTSDDVNKSRHYTAKKEDTELFNALLEDDFDGSYSKMCDALTDNEAKDRFSKNYKDILNYEKYDRLLDNADFDENSVGQTGIDDTLYNIINDEEYRNRSSINPNMTAGTVALNR